MGGPPAEPGGTTPFAADAALAERCVSGDEAAQRTFVERYAPLVFSICRRRGVPPDLAEDLTQEALADAFRGLRRYRGEARLSSWLFTLACRRIASHFRRAARGPRSRDPRDGSDEHPVDARWEDRFVATDRAARVRHAVEALAEPARSVLLAYYLAELSVREIADELGLPEGTVKSHLHRGRIAVRQKLEGR